MMAELLQCECGNKNIRVSKWGMWRAWCPICLRHSTDELTEKEAKKAWNTRTPKERGVDNG